MKIPPSCNQTTFTEFTSDGQFLSIQLFFQKRPSSSFVYDGRKQRPDAGVKGE